MAVALVIALLRGWNWRALLFPVSLAAAPVPHTWSEVRTSVPETSVKAGENWLCLGFARSAAVKGGARLAAAVASVEIE